MRRRKNRIGGRAIKWGGLVLWAGHVLMSSLGVYRCPRCKGRLNYRWWCSRCKAYRLPAR